MLINVPKNLGPQPVMAGIYLVSCTGAKVDKSKSSDNMVIKPEFSIQNQVDADGNKIQGRKLFDNWTIAEQCLGIWNSGFKALTGIGLDELMGGQSVEIDELINRITSDIQGKQCLVQVVVEESERGPRNTIKKYTPVAG